MLQVATVSGIDLNADLGESGAGRVFDDAAVLPVISSANVACGAHAGEPRGIRLTCERAAELGVTVGAHPGYRDPAGFGRRFIDITPHELTDEMIFQIGAVQAIARSAGTEVRYVKPHGALYHAIAMHEDQATAVVRALLEENSGLPLVVLPGSAVDRLANEAGIRTIPEAFADRGYLPDGSLVPRGAAGAVLSRAAAVRQAVRLAVEGKVTAVDGTEVEVSADSICLHGDNPSAVQLARDIRAGLESAGIEIRSFVSR